MCKSGGRKGSESEMSVTGKSMSSRLAKADCHKAGITTRAMRQFMSGWVEKGSPRGTPRNSPVKKTDSVRMSEVEVTDPKHAHGPE